MRGARFRAAVAAAALACLTPVPATAQEPVEIVPGQTVTGKAGKPDTPGLYYFVGQSGATVAFEVDAPGQVSIALLTSDGDTMLEASGNDSARLEAVLSLTDVFFVAIARSDAGSPHTIKMTAREPDFDLALFSRYVGYRYTEARSSNEESLCWIEPGAVLRGRFGTVVIYWELLRDGRHRGYLQYPGMPFAEMKVTVSSDTLELATTMNGETNIRSVPLDEQTFARPDDASFRYAGYLCE
jgi:hypothetical protein